jgi:hypothetical protein
MRPRSSTGCRTWRSYRELVAADANNAGRHTPADTAFGYKRCRFVRQYVLRTSSQVVCGLSVAENPSRVEVARGVVPAEMMAVRHYYVSIANSIRILGRRPRQQPKLSSGRQRPSEFPVQVSGLHRATTPSLRDCLQTRV